MPTGSWRPHCLSDSSCMYVQGLAGQLMGSLDVAGGFACTGPCRHTKYCSPLAAFQGAIQWQARTYSQLGLFCTLLLSSLGTEEAMKRCDPFKVKLPRLCLLASIHEMKQGSISVISCHCAMLPFVACTASNFRLIGCVLKMPHAHLFKLLIVIPSESRTLQLPMAVLQAWPRALMPGPIRWLMRQRASAEEVIMPFPFAHTGMQNATLDHIADDVCPVPSSLHISWLRILANGLDCLFSKQKVRNVPELFLLPA